MCSTPLFSFTMVRFLLPFTHVPGSLYFPGSPILPLHLLPFSADSTTTPTALATTYLPCRAAVWFGLCSYVRILRCGWRRYLRYHWFTHPRAAHFRSRSGLPSCWFYRVLVPSPFRQKKTPTPTPLPSTTARWFPILSSVLHTYIPYTTPSRSFFFTPTTSGSSTGTRRRWRLPVNLRTLR